MTRQQVTNVCNHFGLSEWSDLFSAWLIDSAGTKLDHDLYQLVKRGRGKDCLDMLRTVINDSPQYREICHPRWIRQLDEALAIAGA